MLQNRCDSGSSYVPYNELIQIGLAVSPIRTTRLIRIYRVKVIIVLRGNHQLRSAIQSIQKSDVGHVAE